MGIFGTFSKLMSGSLRSTLSRYPSSATPQLRASWKRPVTKWFATPQPYTSPLSIPKGNFTLNGETWEMRREYREWSFREPPVKASLLTKCLAVASLDAQLTPEDKTNPDDVAAAKWVDWAINRAAGGWGGLIRNILLPATIDGYSILEPVWDEVDKYHRKYPGHWTVKRFAMIDTENIRFKLDEYRQIIGVRPMTGLTGYIELSPETYLIFSHLKIFENPFGISDLRAVVRDVRALEAAIKLRQILLANWSGPFIKASAATPDERRQMLGILEKARANGVIVVAPGSEVEVLNLATSSPQVFDSAIAFYREQIVSGINGSYLQLLASDSERGSSLVAKSVSELFTWWLALEVAEVVNHQLIPPLVRPNYGNSVGLPRLSLGGINEAQVTAALDRFKKLQDMGLDLSKEQVTTVGGAETPASPEDTLKPPSAQQPPSGQGDPNDPFAGMLSDSRRVHLNTAPATEFVEWKPYTNPDDGRQGYISPGGVVRYEKPGGSDTVASPQVTTPSEGIPVPKVAAAFRPTDNKGVTPEQIKEIAKKTFGRDMSPEKLGAMANAQEGAEVHVGTTESGKMLQVVVFNTNGSKAKRTFYTDHNGDLVVSNDAVENKEKATKGGPSGSQMLFDQVRHLKSEGVKKILTQAQGTKGDPDGYVGYTVWPKLGYDGAMSDEQFGKLPPQIQAAMGAKKGGFLGLGKKRGDRSILALHKIPGGAEAWAEHGSTFAGFFDLSDGSPNLAHLQEYAKKKGLK